MVPQLIVALSPKPRNSSPATASSTWIVVVTKLAATIESSWEKIREKLMRQVRWPPARAAVTNSRLRIESVCARSTRAPQGQLVRATITTMVSVVRLKNSTATIASGNGGSTRKTLVINERAASTTTPKYPLTRPTVTAMMSTSSPANNDHASEERVPTTS